MTLSVHRPLHPTAQPMSPVGWSAQERNVVPTSFQRVPSPTGTAALPQSSPWPAHACSQPAQPLAPPPPTLAVASLLPLFAHGHQEKTPRPLPGFPADADRLRLCSVGRSPGTVLLYQLQRVPHGFAQPLCEDDGGEGDSPQLPPAQHRRADQRHSSLPGFCPDAAAERAYPVVWDCRASDRGRTSTRLNGSVWSRGWDPPFDVLPGSVSGNAMI